jgi:ribonuclease P protein component
VENSKKKFGLSRNERIKSKKDFEKIFSAGETLFSSDKKIRVLYIIDRFPESAGIKIAAVVNKRNGSAVWRNRIKRLLKESYRLNKQILSKICIEKNIAINIVFAFTLTSREMKIARLNDVMPGVVEVMQKLQKIL